MHNIALSSSKKMHIDNIKRQLLLALRLVHNKSPRTTYIHTYIHTYIQEEGRTLDYLPWVKCGVVPP